MWPVLHLVLLRNQLLFSVRRRNTKAITGPHPDALRSPCLSAMHWQSLFTSILRHGFNIGLVRCQELMGGVYSVLSWRSVYVLGKVEKSAGDLPECGLLPTLGRFYRSSCACERLHGNLVQP